MATKTTTSTPSATPIPPQRPVTLAEASGNPPGQQNEQRRIHQGERRLGELQQTPHTRGVSLASHGERHAGGRSVGQEEPHHSDQMNRKAPDIVHLRPPTRVAPQSRGRPTGHLFPIIEPMSALYRARALRPRAF